MIRAVRLRFALIALVIITGSAAASSVPLSAFIYPDAALKEAITLMDDDRLISSLYQAFDTLTALGGEDILVCRVQRIEAPLGGYLIDGLLRIELEGKEFTSFRIGISDSVYDPPFTLIARGVGSEGDVLWYPEPGPDYIYQPDEVMNEASFAYEFLFDREDFENIEIEFSRPVSGGSGSEEDGNAN
jgi:hypothetical protein